MSMSCHVDLPQSALEQVVASYNPEGPRQNLQKGTSKLLGKLDYSAYTEIVNIVHALTRGGKNFSAARRGTENPP